LSLTDIHVLGAPAASWYSIAHAPSADDVLEAPAGRDVLRGELVSGVDVSRLARAQDGSSDA